MSSFVVVELEDGLAIVELKPGQEPEGAALQAGGTLVDSGPFSTYEDAWDAIAELDVAEDEERA